MASVKQEPTVTRCLSYERLRDDPDFPKGRLGFIGWMIKSMWRSLKRGFPKNLLIILGLGLFYWVFNLVFLGIINDSCFFGNGKFRDSSSIAYLFAGLVYQGGAKGFDWIMGRSTTTWFYNFTLMLALAWLLGNIFRRIRAKGFMAPIKDYFSIFSRIGICRRSATIPFMQTVSLWMGAAFILGFILKSPFTVAALALWLLLSFGQGGESPIIYLLFIYQGAVNLKKKKPRAMITGADAALPVLGMGLGMLLYFILIIILWNTVDYSIWPRALTSLLPGAALIFIGVGGRLYLKGGAKTVAGCFLFGFGTLALFSLTAYADDGGWSESGRTLAGWFANPGTQLMEAAGLGGPGGMILGWLGNMVGGGVLDHFTGGVGSAAAGVASGAAEGGTLNIGLGAYNAAMSPLGPVGDLFTNAWGGAIDALAGGGQGGPATGSGYGGGYGGSSGGNGYSGGHGGGFNGNGGNSGNDGLGNIKPPDEELDPWGRPRP